MKKRINDIFMYALFALTAFFSVMSGWNRIGVIGRCGANTVSEIRETRRGHVYEVIDGELVEITDQVEPLEIYFPDGGPGWVWDS